MRGREERDGRRRRIQRIRGSWRERVSRRVDGRDPRRRQGGSCRGTTGD